MPSGLTFLPGQSSVQTVMALAVSSGPEGWSSGMPRTLDVSREGPFDTYASPMDTGHDGLDGLPVSNYVLHWPGGCKYESGVWHAAASPPVSGIYRGARVSSAVESFTGVLDTTFGRGGCSGSGGRSTAGRRYHVVEPSDSFAVFLDAGSGDGTCRVPFRGGSGFVYDTEGTPGGQVHGCDGLMASTDWSG